MKDKVFISGHRIPDTDSICSALAYAELKNRIGDIDAIPIRLGELNQETRFVLNYFNIKAPRYVETLKPSLGEIDIDVARGISGDTSLWKASQLIENNHLNSLAIVDADNKLEGVISLSNITKAYANVWDDTILGRSNTSLENILEVLAAEIIVLPENPRAFDGSFNIYAMSHVNNQLIHMNDIVLVGDRRDAQKDALDREISLLVLTNNSKLAEEDVELAKENNVTVISTALSTFMAARLIPQAVPVSFLMTRDNIVTFHLSDMMDDAQKIMASTRYRSYPVLDAQNRVVGSISRYHVINTERKKVILVDHNEASQSIPDLDQAEILEIIDHHRIANINTSQPIYFRNVPVGCTATIISGMYFENGIRPSREMAGLMCAAIISDTLLFRSPTATNDDRKAIERLAPIAGINPKEFAMEMFRAGTDISHKKPTDLLTQDVKFFNIDKIGAKIAQVFTMNLEALDTMRPKIVERMQELLQQQSEDLYILAITDIFNERSVILIAGEYAEEIAEEFGQKLEHNSFVGEGILSRKKQIIPKVTAAISKAVK